MKAFRNPLENILEIRRLQERQRETELAVAAQARDREQDALDQIRTRRNSAAHYVPNTDAPGAGRAFLMREEYVRHQDRLARQQKEALVRAEKQVEERQRILVDARREVRGLEVHRGKLHDRWELEFRRSEQRETDDIVSAQRQQNESAKPTSP